MQQKLLMAYKRHLQVTSELQASPTRYMWPTGITYSWQNKKGVYISHTFAWQSHCRKICSAKE
jgi:hypothetical protein